jgi:DNA-binding MarR family transcriptional regulator
MEFKPEDSIGFLVRQTGRALRIKVHQELKAQGHDLTMEQGGVLMRLSMIDGQQQGELACFLSKDKTTVARLLDGMERNSLIVRVASKEDKRIKQIYLTHKGREMSDVVKTCVMKTIKQGVNGVAEKDVEVTKSVLKQMILNLGQSGEDCGPCE